VNRELIGCLDTPTAARVIQASAAAGEAQKKMAFFSALPECEHLHENSNYSLE
jgi:hypothetical protein